MVCQQLRYLRLNPNKVDKHAQSRRYISYICEWWNVRSKIKKQDGGSNRKIPLINLKGTDEIERGGQSLITDGRQEKILEQFVNEKLFIAQSGRSWSE